MNNKYTWCLLASYLVGSLYWSICCCETKQRFGISGMIWSGNLYNSVQYPKNSSLLSLVLVNLNQSPSWVVISIPGFPWISAGTTPLTLVNRIWCTIDLPLFALLLLLNTSTLAGFPAESVEYITINPFLVACKHTAITP